MRILHVIPSFAPAWRYGGPVRAAYEMCRALAERGHEVQVFTTDIDGPGRLDVPVDRPVSMDGFTVRYFPVASPRSWCWSRPLADALDREAGGFDIAHLHSTFLWPTLAAARACRKAGTPFLLRPAGSLDPMCVAHSYERGLKPLLSRAKKALYLRTLGAREVNQAHALHFTSDSERDRSLPTTPGAGAVVVPLGVRAETGDARRWDDLRADAAGRKIVLYLSRLDPKKGLDLLVPALAELSRKREDFLFVVAGDGDAAFRRTFETSLERNGLTERTRLLGRVDGAAKWSLFEAADLFVLPSHHENFGLAAAEALSAGVPSVLGAGVAVSAEAEAVGAALTPALTSEAIADAVESLLDDAALRSRMGDAGRALAARRYSWPSIARELEAVYAEAAS